MKREVIFLSNIKLYFISVFTDRVTDLLADFNPPEVSIPALGWDLSTFYHMNCDIFGFFRIWQSTLAQCVTASHIAYSV